MLSLARLAELSGRTEEARQLYGRAIEAGAGAEGLVGFLVLSFAMNDGDAVQAGIEALRAGDAGWAGVIEGMADLAAGRADSAREKLALAARDGCDPRAAIAAFWGLAECARKSEDPAALAAARAEIDRRFPGSPEQALAAGLISRLASPAQFAVSADSPPDETASAGKPAVQAAAPASPARFAVQAGSFQVKENADYLAADLSTKGFAPTVRGETRDGRQLFKVIAGAGLERAAAEQLVGQLVKAGFAGFLISEAR